MPSPSLEVEPQQLKALLDAAPGNPPVLLDVREAWEVELAPVPGAIHLPLGLVPARATTLLNPQHPTVVVCHHGVRSLHATMVLRSLGFGDVRSLRGGTDLWARTVDVNMPRY